MNDLQTLIVYVLAIVLIALAVWLIAVRRETGRNAAKLFGLEFDLSTPGVAVLLAGCGLLVLAALVPHRPGGLPDLSGLFRGSDEGGAGYSVIRQETVLSKEKEPNDSTSSANVIELGQTVAGALDYEHSRGRDNDYFILRSPEEPPRPKRMILRTKGWHGGSVHLTVWDGLERELGEQRANGGDTISMRVPPSAEYVVRIGLDAGIATSLTYEFVSVEDQEAN